MIGVYDVFPLSSPSAFYVLCVVSEKTPRPNMCPCLISAARYEGKQLQDGLGSDWFALMPFLQTANALGPRSERVTPKSRSL